MPTARSMLSDSSHGPLPFRPSDHCPSRAKQPPRRICASPSCDREQSRRTLRLTVASMTERLCRPLARGADERACASAPHAAAAASAPAGAVARSTWCRRQGTATGAAGAMQWLVALRAIAGARPQRAPDHPSGWLPLAEAKQGYAATVVVAIDCFVDRARPRRPSASTATASELWSHLRCSRDVVRCGLINAGVPQRLDDCAAVVAYDLAKEDASNDP